MAGRGWKLPVHFEQADIPTVPPQRQLPAGYAGTLAAAATTSAKMAPAFAFAIVQSEGTKPPTALKRR
jgi:hypothetical protein